MFNLKTMVILDTGVKERVQRIRGRKRKKRQ